MIITVCTSVVAQMKYNGKNIPQLLYGQKSFQNKILDEQSFVDSVLFLDSPIQANVLMSQSGLIEREYPIRVYFMFKSQPDWSPLEHDQNCIQHARLLVNQFITRLQENENVQTVRNASEIEFINLFDVNVSGIVLSLTVKLNYTNTLCLE
jgi:hypothetical protein